MIVEKKNNIFAVVIALGSIAGCSASLSAGNTSYGKQLDKGNKLDIGFASPDQAQQFKSIESESTVREGYGSKSSKATSKGKANKSSKESKGNAKGKSKSGKGSEAKSNKASTSPPSESPTESPPTSPPSASPTESSPTSPPSASPTESFQYDFIIGGMGAAGMGAVYTLKDIGNVENFLVLEAKEDMGGKVWATDFGGYKVETAAGYISGGVDNPFYCEMEKFVGEGNTFRGYNVQGEMQVNNDDGEVVLGDYDDDWAYDWEGTPKTVGERLTRAYYEGEWYGQFCLNPEQYSGLKRNQRKWCNALCDINITEIPDDHQGPEGILDLVVTEKNPCNNTGQWTPSETNDISVTDLMRVDSYYGTYFAPNDPAGACVARTVEYIYADKELGNLPWRTSAKSYFSDTAIFGGDFGEERDFLVTDNKSYVYILKRVMAEVLQTSVHTPENIVFDETQRLYFNSKITKVEWDPAGEKDVTVTYCETKKEGQQSYPCVDDTRHKRRAKNFISTFPIGVLKKSMECGSSDEDCITFDPPLSSMEELAESLNVVEMGVLTKVYLQFYCKFWSDKETYFTPSNSSGYDCDAAPLIYSLDGQNGLDGSKILAIALAGPRGKEAAEMGGSNDSIRKAWVCDEFLPVLNLHFQAGIEDTCGKTELTCDDIKDIMMPTWSTDPLSHGCWLTSPLGSAGKYNFTVGVQGNMILSGEGTCKRQVGWVTGGYFSGERSAKIMLKERQEGFEDLDTRTLCDYPRQDNFNFNNGTCKFEPM